jgi:hypothetical protein
MGDGDLIGIDPERRIRNVHRGAAAQQKPPSLSDLGQVANLWTSLRGVNGPTEFSIHSSGIFLHFPLLLPRFRTNREHPPMRDVCQSKAARPDARHAPDHAMGAEIWARKRSRSQIGRPPPRAR